MARTEKIRRTWNVHNTSQYHPSKLGCFRQLSFFGQPILKLVINKSPIPCPELAGKHCLSNTPKPKLLCIRYSGVLNTKDAKFKISKDFKAKNGKLQPLNIFLNTLLV